MSGRDCTVCETTRPDAGIEERYSCGLFAGRLCRACWRESGMRGAGENLSEADAGERIEEEVVEIIRPSPVIACSSP